jgi:YbbR domain-containing protein
MRLATNIRTFLLALVLGIAVWVSAVSAADPDEVSAFPQSVPIEIIGQDASLIIINQLPSNVDVRIRAPRSVWETLNTEDNAVRAILDLSGLGAGEHTVPIQVQVSERPVQVVSVNPQTVTVDLEQVSMSTLPLTPSLTGQPSAGYQAGDPELAVNEVVISGPKMLVDAAKRARVDVNLDGKRETIHEEVPIQIFDSKNELIRGLTLNPESVQVTVPFNQQGGFHDIVVSVVVQGQVAPGYRLENISVFPPVVTLSGANPAVVSALHGVVETQPLDIQDAKEDISTRLSLNLPENVTLVGAQTVQVQVSITPIQSSITLRNLPIYVVGLGEGFSVQTFPEKVNVIVSGPLPVLDVLRPEDLRFIVDVTGLGLGSHQVIPEPDHVSGNILVESILPGTVEVVISLQGTATPTPLVTPTVGP